MFLRIINDFSTLLEAVKISHKNPFFIFEEVLWVALTFILILFLSSLGKKVFQVFKLEASDGVEFLFSFGLGIIVWGNLILALGILNILHFWLIWGIFGTLFIICSAEAKELLKKLKGGVLLENVKKQWRQRKSEKWLIIIFILFISLNFIGALTPEKGVDAIGYHLYFPKVYLQNKTMMLPARGSRLFSLFPHLASMIYLLPVSLNMPNIAQLLHFSLGLLTAITIGLISHSVVAPLIFYSALTVGSVSRSAYSDFFVTFFLSLGILGWIRGVSDNEENNKKWVVLAGLIFGGGLVAKNQSLALIPLIVMIIIFWERKKIPFLPKLILYALLIPLPWYLRSFIISGNPFYPLYSLKDLRVPEFNFSYYLNFEFLKYLKVIVLFQPVLVLVLLSVFYIFKNVNLRKKFIAGVLVFLYWVLLPKSFHDNRYFLPYFILIILLWSSIFIELIKNNLFRFVLLGIAVILLAARFYSNVQYLPYIIGAEEEKIFLSNALRTRIEDFYDIDGQFSRFITPNDKVLTDNVLGLYYLDFPFEEFEYSAFWQKTLSLDEFKNIWKSQNFSYLIIKNESLGQFFDKIGVERDMENLFVLKVACEPARTYLYQSIFK